MIFRKGSGIEVDDEELPDQELDSSRKDKWLLQVDMARRATHKYQENASESESSDKRKHAVDLQKVILLPQLPGNKDFHFLKWFGSFQQDIYRDTSKRYRICLVKKFVLCAVA